jgi:hypothetical protein
MIDETPYGYRVAADGIQLEEHDGEQKVIQAVNEYRAAGLSDAEIKLKLAAHGFTLAAELHK